MNLRRPMPWNEEVDSCPTCEGWRPIEKEHCSDCYEGQIERLLLKIEELKNDKLALESDIKKLRDDFATYISFPSVFPKK